jgi:hypothetical protein
MNQIVAAPPLKSVGEKSAIGLIIASMSASALISIIKRRRGDPA